MKYTTLLSGGVNRQEAAICSGTSGVFGVPSTFNIDGVQYIAVQWDRGWHFTTHAKKH
jgi:hypothetical protein